MFLGWGKVAAFADGALLGSAGVKILTSKDAKQIYVQCLTNLLPQ